jgi:putative (di)nucleoside polyphosphate hydrolase
MALTELARYLPRTNHHNRYLRSGLRAQHLQGETAEPPPPEGTAPSAE